MVCIELKLRIKTSWGIKQKDADEVKTEGAKKIFKQRNFAELDRINKYNFKENCKS